jgi:cellulose biosynthesis protein BcsQ
MSSFLLKNKETIIQGLQVVMIGGIIYYVYKNINKLKKDVKSNRQLISSHDIMLSEQNDLVIKINESLDMLQNNQQIIIRNSITNNKTEKYDNSEKSVENIKYETSNISHEVIKNDFSDIKYPNTIYEESNTQKDLNDEIAEELRELELELLDEEIIGSYS